MNYTMITPCSSCPFRTDIRPYLRTDRAQEIADSLAQVEFPCHKTVEHDDDDDSDFHVPGPNELHCAGVLIVLELSEQPSQMMRISERLGLYDPTKLDMDAPVYDDLDEWVEAQEC